MRRPASSRPARCARRTLVVAAVGAILVPVGVAVASDYPRAGLFSGSGVVSASGLRVAVAGGGNVCTKGEALTLDVTISQHATSAVAKGTWTGTCTGASQSWHTVAHVADGVRFAPGCAIGVALGIIRLHGRANGAHQWLTALKLTTASGTRGTAPASTC
jgi:hypothetical protein